jgi:hypothetical protein
MKCSFKVRASPVDHALSRVVRGGACTNGARIDAGNNEKFFGKIALETAAANHAARRSARGVNGNS